MKSSTGVILVLLVLLVASNAFWIWQQVHITVGDFYGDRQLLQTQHRSIRLISALAQGKSKEDVSRIIEEEYGFRPSLAPDGSLSVDYMQIQFDKSGRLLSVKAIGEGSVSD